jgi:hypothetical protein
MATNKEIEDFLHAVVLGNIGEVIKLLSKNEGLSNPCTSENITALHIAAANENIDIVKLLIEKGASINAQDNKGLYPVEYAIRHAVKYINGERFFNIEIVEEFVKQKDKTSIGFAKGYPLHLAAGAGGHNALVCFLIEIWHSQHEKEQTQTAIEKPTKEGDKPKKCWSKEFTPESTYSKETEGGEILKSYLFN